MSALYEVLQTNMVTGEVVATLPVTAIGYTDSLNAAGSATVTIPLDAPEAARGVLEPAVSGLVVTRDAEPVWGGILWTLNADLGGGTLTLNASGYHSYYSGRYLDNFRGYNRPATDQALLLTDWIEYANESGGIGTDTSFLSPTGRIRTRKWSYWEFKNIGQAIEELADDAGGFYFRYAPYWIEKGKRLGNRFLKRGRGESLFPYQLEHRKNCNVTAVSYDGSSMATHVVAFGADTGTGAKAAAGKTNNALVGVMPKRTEVATYSDVKDVATLGPKAAGIAAVGNAPIAIPTLTLYPGLFNPADFVPGDTGTVIADYGYVALFDEYVITERKVDVDTNGTELIGLSLANKEVFEIDDSV
ncbi:hypothetical protein AB0M39_33405 [Streptomyces sp. NPDC051907]|uniref:hypothetical protein n=1 Tax=Streptomyces sp. NPDC051907 TaxID=3155284 RepID=UPI00343B7300